MSKILSGSLYLAVCEIEHIFAFYVEIQGGRRMWRENDFGEKSPVESSYTLRVKISSKSLYLIFALNAEIQDGRQKWQENCFFAKSHQ